MKKALTADINLNLPLCVYLLLLSLPLRIQRSCTLYIRFVYRPFFFLSLAIRAVIWFMYTYTCFFFCSSESIDENVIISPYNNKLFMTQW